MESNSKSNVSSDILLWTQRCAAHRLSLVGNICMDGAHAHTNHYFSPFERQPSDTVKEDTEENTEEDTEDDIIPELIRFFTLEIVEFNTETAEENIIPELIKIPLPQFSILVIL
jgi:hypothetical protein